MFLYQPPKGYCYNSDSIFLVDFIRRFTPRGKLLDVGSGVGIISLLLGRDYPVEVHLSEKQLRMLEYALHNFAINGIEARTYPGDFLEARIAERFDLIVSNPPFYDPRVTQSEEESLNIARYAHHLPLEPFVARVKRLLKPRGRFILCYDAKQSDRLLAALREAKLTPETLRFVHPKIDREAKILLVQARAGSKSLCRILPPLVVFDERGEYTPEAAGAFERAGTHSIKGERSNE
jgi:tRNA1(Val) A37 N6-methylase TrmN6